MILVTGATGFVGQKLVKELLKKHYDLMVAVRRFSSNLPESIIQNQIGDMLPTTDWTSSLQNVDVVIHSAARVHVMNEGSEDPLAEFRKVNVEGTLNLARQAAHTGVKRFIFISSIKVNGESTSHDRPFTPSDTYVTLDPYGVSKREAEQKLRTLAKQTGMEVVIIRPPLVYGEGVKANFRSLIKWVEKGVPLPLGAVHNKRSFVALENLVDFIIHCVVHPKAANETFLISDNQDVSTTELLQKIAKAFEKSTFLLPVPVYVMRFLAAVIGKQDVADRLFGSLQVDSSKARNLLGWKPAVTMDEQLKKTVEAYKHEKGV